MVETTAVTKLRQLVEVSDNIVIIPHHNPDGDAIGASLALCGILRQKKKNVNVVSPNSFPEFLQWMPGAKEVISFEDESEKAKAVLSEAGLLFFLDFNGLSRLRSMESVVREVSCMKVMIDHHPEPENIADVIISEPDASATCELIYDVIKKAGWKELISKELAECIYTGIMTDTGSLSYNSSRPEIYHIVADLVGIGVDKDKVHKLVFHSNSFDRMRLLGHALGQKMFRLDDAPAAYIELSAEELKRFNFKPGDSEGFVNYPLWIEGISVSALFMEHPDKIKISLRSQGDIPVNKFSEMYFNGGGHLNAAGGEFYGELNEAVNVFRKELPVFLKNNL
ncbi:MAG: bifunctional oligoribonuclease/PAP phosphatase NrnA [Chlorobi bacterium]|nr:bifunctional oligoribonuclease/PAP phosphatase NrnA [Chlorobiota bacterium]